MGKVVWLKSISISIFMLLIYLGCWQLWRMEEKNVILAKIDNASNSSLEGGIVEYSKYALDGQFLYENNIFLYASNMHHPEKNGYFVLTPFCTKELGCIIVNRGWIPKSQRLSVDTGQAQKTRHIEAMAIKARKASIFLPDNDLEKNIWFYVDLRAMSRFTGVDLENDFYMVLLQGVDLPQDLMPVNPQDFFAIRNDHFSYAITWFSLAIAMLAFMVAKFKEKSNTG
jgi:surfeit locus 1 family protein